MLDIEGLRSHMLSRRYGYAFINSICARLKKAISANITEDELISLSPHMLAVRIYGSDDYYRHKRCATLQNQYADYLRHIGDVE